MIVLTRIVLRLLADVAGLVALSLRPRRSVAAENLFLRRGPALYRERRVKPRRIDATTRVSLALARPAGLSADGAQVHTETTAGSPARRSALVDFPAQSRVGDRRLSESHLRSILGEWVGNYNQGRPHMALGPGVPDPPSQLVPSETPLTRHRIGERLRVRARSLLGGMHHEYMPATATA